MADGTMQGDTMGAGTIRVGSIRGRTMEQHNHEVRRMRYEVRGMRYVA